MQLHSGHRSTEQSFGLGQVRHHRVLTMLILPRTGVFLLKHSQVAMTALNSSILMLKERIHKINILIDKSRYWFSIFFLKLFCKESDDFFVVLREFQMFQKIHLDPSNLSIMKQEQISL